MKTNRQDFLTRLESASAALSTKDTTPQSSCFAFQDGEIRCFNEESAARIPLPESLQEMNLNCAVSGEHLLELLRRMVADEVDCTVNVEKSSFAVKGAGAERALIRMESQISMPYGCVDQPTRWRPIAAEFSDAVAFVQGCANKHHDNHRITCIHVHPDYVEATDNFQVARFYVYTQVKHSILIKQTSLKQVVALGFVEMAETRSWLHFRNSLGLHYSCHRHTEEPINTEAFFEGKGKPIAFPGDLKEAIEKARIFAKEQTSDVVVGVDLKEGKMRLTGSGPPGLFQRVYDVDYEGEPFSFFIPPDLFLEILKRQKRCSVAPRRLRIEGKNFSYVACLQVPKVAAS